MAFLINCRKDLDEEFIRADLFGGNMDFCAPVEWNGRVVEDANVDFCIRKGLRISAQLLAAVPNAAKVEINPDGSLPDVGPAMINGWIVSEAFRNIAEHLEPGKHQYFPVDATVTSTGQPTPKKLYLLNVLNRVGATVPELSDIRTKTLSTGVTAFLLAEPVRKLTLQKDKIKNLHLWGGGVWDLSMQKFCSDEFAEAMKAADLRGFKYFKCDEI